MLQNENVSAFQDVPVFRDALNLPQYQGQSFLESERRDGKKFKFNFINKLFKNGIHALIFSVLIYLSFKDIEFRMSYFSANDILMMEATMSASWCSGRVSNIFRSRLTTGRLSLSIKSKSSTARIRKALMRESRTGSGGEI